MRPVAWLRWYGTYIVVGSCIGRYVDSCSMQVIYILWVVYPVRLSRPPDTVLVSPRLRYPIMTPGRTSPPCLATGPIDCFGAPYVVTTVPRVCTHDTLAAQRGSHSSAGPHSRMNPRLNSDAHAVSPAQLYRALSHCVYGIDATARAGACYAHVLSVRTYGTVPR